MTTYDGSPCKLGHGTKRYTSNNTCVVCNAAARKASTKAKSAISTRYVGSICTKHPELKGVRLSSNGTCVYCHRDRSAARQKRNGYPIMARQIEKLADEVRKHYGDKCERCGDSDPDTLTVDHIDQKGAEHKSSSGKRYSGTGLHRWLRKNNYPPGFRVLCIRCNVKVYKLHLRGEPE